MVSIDFNPAEDIPDLSNKVIFITGGTNGLGKKTVHHLASHNPAKIIFTGRKQAAADAVISQCKAQYPSVPVSFIKCDLASLDAVKTGAKQILAQNDRLDILLAVAGIMCVPAALTTDGYEMQFGTNHVGHALLITLLLPLLEKTAASPASDVRVVIYSSEAAQPPLPPAGGIEFEKLKTTQDMMFGGWRRYGQSKVANVLYARELAKRHPSLTIVPIHPGVAMTNLVDSLGFFYRWFVKIAAASQTRPPNEVAWNGLWAATAPRKGKDQKGDKLREVESGVFYNPVGVTAPLAGALGDDKVAERLWQWTEHELAKWSA